MNEWAAPRDWQTEHGICTRFVPPTIDMMCVMHRFNPPTHDDAKKLSRWELEKILGVSVGDATNMIDSSVDWARVRLDDEEILNYWILLKGDEQI